MELPSIHSSVKASVMPFEKMATNPNVSQQDKVAEACRQFEGILVKQILTQARKSSATTAGGAESSASSIYDDMINTQYAESISHSGAFGLAAALQKQLIPQVKARAGDAAKVAPAGHNPATSTATKLIHD